MQAQGRVWRGTAGGGLLNHLLELDLGGYPIPYALLGVVQPGRLDPGTEPEYTRADRAVVSLRDGERRRRIWVDLFRGFVSREEVYEGTHLAWSRQLRQYRRVGKGYEAVYLPREVEIRQGDRTIELSFRRYTVNEGIEDGSFRRGIPVSAN